MKPTKEQVDEWRATAIHLHNQESGLTGFYEKLCDLAANWGAAQQIETLAAGVSMKPARMHDNPEAFMYANTGFYTPDQLRIAIAAARVQEQQVSSSNMEACKGLIKGLTAERDAARVQAINECLNECKGTNMVSLCITRIRALLGEEKL